MEPIVYTIKDVAELLQCSESSVNNLRERGILREVKGLPGVRFNKKEVEALVGIVDEYSPLQYRKLEKERNELLQENEKLKMSIRKITSDFTGYGRRGVEVVIIALKWAAFIWIIGSMGSLEIDKIGFFQFLLQIIIGGLVWVCADVYEKENAR